jgi:ABC-type transport system involved in cytochrome c biogenesis permease subunit
MSDKKSNAGRQIAAALAVTGLVAVFYQVVADNMPKGDVRKVEGYTPWAEETVTAAETLPVQDGGRVKPLATYAGFTMLGLHGARSMKIEIPGKGEITLKPVPWMLDVLFRPRLAIQQPTFRVDNSAVLEAIGVKARGKRDRYSYADIEGGREKLHRLSQSYAKIETEKRDPLQNQVLDLGANVRTYESLLGYFSFARFGVSMQGSAEGGGEDKRADLSAMMYATTTPEIRKQLDQSRSGGTPVEPRLENLLRQVVDASNLAKSGLMILPPADRTDKTWKSAGNAIMDVVEGTTKDLQTPIDDISALESLTRSIQTDEAAFRGELVSFCQKTTRRAATRGEGENIGVEATYYRKNWFLNALVFFLAGSVAALGMGILGRSGAGRVCYWITLASCVAGLAYCVIAITMRCVIMWRPPVGNLYDTVVFIAAAVVALSLFLEWLVPRRFALGIAPVLGALLIVLARRFELGDAKDHMDPLVAVLNSNYWLTIHVITITLGYSAGLLGAFLSTGYVLMRGLDLDGGDEALRRVLTRVVYGMICFTAFLSLVGTVLGGIWANDSWGRFWGWDPKENGALLIVLWTLAILHARLGGFLHEWGLHLASVFTAIVVTFSWWHVNFLGVGLHNYGFTSGKDTIWMFYGCMAVILLFGVGSMIFEKTRPGPPIEPDGEG